MNTFFLIAAVIIIMLRCFKLVAELSHKEWPGQRLQFTGLALAYSIIPGGALGLLLGWPPAPFYLLAGVVGVVVFDRRMTL